MIGIIGCSLAVVPTRYPTFLIATSAIDNNYSVITNTVRTLSNNFSEYIVTFGFNGTDQTVNRSYCNISSLEVYRGREQAIEISHQGFSLNDNGSIEVRR